MIYLCLNLQPCTSSLSERSSFGPLSPNVQVWIDDDEVSSLRTPEEDPCGRFAYDSARFKMRRFLTCPFFCRRCRCRFIRRRPWLSGRHFWTSRLNRPRNRPRQRLPGLPSPYLAQERVARFDGARFRMINGRGRDLSGDFLLFDRENGVPEASLSPKRRYLRKSVICGIPDITALR